MHNLEQSIAAWRQTMKAAPHVDPETLDELENHLREIVDQLASSGMAEAEAFDRAVARLGSPAMIAAEFQKLSPSSWLPARVVTIIGLTATAALLIFVPAHLHGRPQEALLVAHVLTVTLGYAATLLLGILGICFIAQRSVRDFSARRLRFLSRVTFRGACVAASLTSAGVFLGMIWSKLEWGRFWGWDPKEMGGLCVSVWLLSFLLAHRSSRVTARGLFVSSVLGSNVTLLAWVGPNLPPAGLHSYGTAHYEELLLIAVMANFMFFLAGMAPAGWLRLKRA